MRQASLCVVALLAAFTASSARADEPAESEYGSSPTTMRYPPSSVRLKLVGGGLALSGLAYGAAYLCASTWPEAPGADQLKIPVIGPWMALGKSGCAADDPDCGFAMYFRAILTVLDGVIQAGGLGIAGEGVFMTTEANARPKKKTTESSRIVVRPVPVVTSRTTGLGVVGVF